MKKTQNHAIPRADKPEDAGVSSRAVAAFLDDIEQSGINIHSFMIIRHGKVAAECFRAPYTANRPHAMYSVSKTFSATALGIAVGEGLISLDDRVVDLLPDYCAGLNDEKLQKLTMRHLVTMTSGKSPALITDKAKENWIKSYLACPWYNEPGKEYRYINENIYMICAILTRVTGMSVRDYLEPRLFKPLGIDYPFWETDTDGVEAGGWGLYARTEDVAKLMLCYHQNGKYEGKQVIPEDWAIAAHQIQADNSSNSALDSRAGYGYCIWRCGGINGYRADGMFSQFGIVFEDYDAVLAITSGVAIEQDTRDFLWKHFPKVFEDADNNDDGSTYVPGLDVRMSKAQLERAEKRSSSSLEEKIDGQPIHFRKNILLNIVGFPMSMLPLAITYMTTDRAGNIDGLTFSFQKNDCSMSWTEGDEANTVRCGMDGRYRYSTMRLGQIDYRVCCTAAWTENDRFYVTVRPIETIGKRILDIKFKENGRVKMKPYSDPSVYEIAEFLLASLSDLIKIKPLQTAAGICFKLLPGIVEPLHRGKIKYK